MDHNRVPPDEGEEYIYRTVITARNGRRLLCFDYGLQAWKIRVKRRHPNDKR